MPWVVEEAIEQAWTKYENIRAKMPAILLEEGCICFSAYLHIPLQKPRTTSSRTLYYMKDDAFKKLEQFLGPHGEALFWAWAHRQGKS
jgi:hypothetical protein